MSKNKIRCSVSGLWYGVTTQTREKRIAKFGSVEAYESGYVSRVAKRLRAEGKTDEEIKAMADAGSITSDMASPKMKVARKATAKDVTPATETIEVEDKEVESFLAD